MFKTIKTLPLHPLLFAIFPALSLYNHNKDMAQLSYLWRPLALSLLLALGIFALVRLPIRDRNKAALSATLFLACFFSFGHLLAAVPDLSLGGITISADLLLLLAMSVIFIAVTALIRASERKFQVLTVFLNNMSVILALVLISNIFIYEYQTGNAARSYSANDQKSSTGAAQAAGADELPDIYYIILDGYARADILKEVYDYDNSEFLGFLREQGFYIADRSRTNYAQTYLSLASSLNFDYLDNLIPDVDRSSSDRKLPRQLIRQNKVQETLKDRGYKLVAFPSTWAGYNGNVSTDVKFLNNLDLNEFDSLLLASTPLYSLLGRDIELKWCRDKLFYTINSLPGLTADPEPTFTYVHLLIPHPPFLFDRDGNGIDPGTAIIGNDGSHFFKNAPTDSDLADYRQKYRDQLHFLNGQIMEMITKLMTDSPVPPIIIIQSDHGPGSMTDWTSLDHTNLPERLSNLNAYLLPSSASIRLYPEITPVNSFRIVFNGLFGLDLPLLPDRSYFSTWNRPYELIDVTSRLDLAGEGKSLD